MSRNFDNTSLANVIASEDIKETDRVEPALHKTIQKASPVRKIHEKCVLLILGSRTFKFQRRTNLNDSFGVFRNRLSYLEREVENLRFLRGHLIVFMIRLI